MDKTDSGYAAGQARMSEREIQKIWDAAARIDGSLEIAARLAVKLLKKRVNPMPYSRSSLFDRMVLGEPSLFTKFPIHVDGEERDRPELSRLVEVIHSGFSQSKRARVRTRNRIEYLPISRLLKRWMGERSVFGVTDLHYWNSRFDTRVNTRGLNDFNLLPRGTDGFQSQDSLVISSAAAVTDSHSDDHSGSNHCFIGTKLWLLWDTLEGFEYGLEDVERCEVVDRAAFNMSAFVAMSSSRWILIGPGQTMFIPAHLTHKVVTLERYLGIGSFHAALPGFIDLLERWSQLLPGWASPNGSDRRRTVDFITRRAIRKIQSLRTASRQERFRWGVPHLKLRLRHPNLNTGGLRQERTTTENANLMAFMHAARGL